MFLKKLRNYNRPDEVAYKNSNLKSRLNYLSDDRIKLPEMITEILS